MSPLHAHSVNNTVHVDHGGRSQSPHLSRSGSNYRSTSPRCRQADPESFRALSNSCASKLMLRKDQDDVDRLLSDRISGKTSFCDSEIDDTQGIMEKTSLSGKTQKSPQQSKSIANSTIVKKKIVETRRAAGPVSFRSTPTKPPQPYTLLTPPSKSSVQSMSPISPLASSPMNFPERTTNCSAHQLSKSSASVTSGNILSTPVKNNDNTPGDRTSTRIGPNLRIQTTPSTGTPGSRKAAAAPVSVRSTNKLPEKKIESNNSSPRSCFGSTNTTPRHSNVVILGASASSKKKSPNSVGGSGSKSSKENSSPISPKESSLSRTFSRGKEAFFGSKGVTRGVLGKHLGPSESYQSSNSIDSEETDSGKYLRFNPKFNPKYNSSGNNSNNSSSNDIISSLNFDDDNRSNVLPSNKKSSDDRLKIVEALNSDLPSGVRANRVNSSNKIIKDNKINDGNRDINKNVQTTSGKIFDEKLKNIKNSIKSSLPSSPSPSSSSTTPEIIIKKSIATSVSSLWAFATEISNNNEKINNNDFIIDDIEIDKKMNMNNKNKPNRMSAEAIAGAIARQGGKVSAPFNSKFLTVFSNTISNNSNKNKDDSNHNVDKNNNHDNNDNNNSNNSNISISNNDKNKNDNNNISNMQEITCVNLAKASASLLVSHSSNTTQYSTMNTFPEKYDESKIDGPRRRRSSAPTIASDITSDTSEDNNTHKYGNNNGTGTTTGLSTPTSSHTKKIGTRTKKSGRAVSLPTIPSYATNDGYRTTFISSLWNLSSELSDPEKDGTDTAASRHSSSNSNTSS